MKKAISALVLAFLIAFAFVPVQSFAQTFSTPKAQFQEEISYETLLAICDALEDLDYCFAEEALQWYKEGSMTIEKVDSNSYQIEMHGGGLLILLEDAL